MMIGTKQDHGSFAVNRNISAWPATETPYVTLTEALAAALDTREHETGLLSKRVACHTMVLANVR